MAKRKQPNKTIVALDDHEHVRLKPTMWLGSISGSDETVPIIENGKIINKPKHVSVAFYKCMNEVLDNAFDEAKRLRGAMDKIDVEFDTKTKKVTIHDFGEGFYQGTEINEKTGITNIETAMSELKAGTNFFNRDDEDTLVGTNGVGASLVNMLSKEFTIETVNKDMYFKKTWENFIGQKPIIRKKKRGEKTGTKISFILMDETQVRDEKITLFKKFNWDKEYIHTLMNFRNYLKNNDPVISNLEFTVKFDGVKLNLDENFLPENSVIVNSKIGIVALWESFDKSDTISFVNGAQCSGIHQKIINDWVNDIFEYHLAHHFYESMVILNLSPKLVQFADQNKTKFSTSRNEIEDLIEKSFRKRLERELKKSELFNIIQKKVDERLFDDNMKKIKRESKKRKKKISDKYHPASVNKETLYIVEGLSASGSLMQRRNPKTDGVYALKGKIKNAKRITDLSNNSEIIDLMSILGLEPKKKNRPNYDKIVIAADWDPDGGHIASLIINLFYLWFPYIIKENRLQILITPLVSADIGKSRSYFYSVKEYQEYVNKGEVFTNVRYLKGLGSLSIQDWDWVMKQRRTFVIYYDRSAKKYMNIAFGNNSNIRKKWLQS